MHIDPSQRHHVDGVVGDLRRMRDVTSHVLGRTFDLSIWLPEGYDSDPSRRWPVVYFCDGHNLHDPAESAFGGVWHAGRALARVDAIGIGVPCHPTERLEEYTPRFSPEAFARFPELGVGRGARYRDFLVEELKPAVDAALRTLPDPGHTAVVGSSAGGVMALWSWASCPDVIGLAGVLSPALWLGGDALFDDVARACRAGVRGRLAVDVGGHEGDAPVSRRYVADAEALVAMLRGNPRMSLRYEYCSDDIHHEAAWARRLPGVLAHLFPHEETA